MSNECQSCKHGSQCGIEVAYERLEQVATNLPIQTARDFMDDCDNAEWGADSARRIFERICIVARSANFALLARDPICNGYIASQKEFDSQNP